MQTLKEWQKYGSSVSYKLILFDSHPQIVTFFIEVADQQKTFLSFVYAKCTAVERQHLWTHMRQLSSVITQPWLVGGDFNASASMLAKNWAEISLLAMDDFHEAITASGLSDGCGISGQQVHLEQQPRRYLLHQSTSR
jgi:hypothetical protein